MALSYRDYLLIDLLKFSKYKSVEEIKSRLSDSELHRLILWSLRDKPELSGVKDLDELMDCGGNNYVCSVCGKLIENEYGYSAEPINSGICCKLCSCLYVSRAKLGRNVELPKIE